MGATGRRTARAARAWRRAVAGRLRDWLFSLGWHPGWTVRNPIAYECTGEHMAAQAASHAPRNALRRFVPSAPGAPPALVRGRTTRPAALPERHRMVRGFGLAALVYQPTENASAWLEDNVRGRFKPTWSPEYAMPMLTFSRQEDAARFRLAFPDREASERAGLLWIGPETPPLAVFTVRR